MPRTRTLHPRRLLPPGALALALTLALSAAAVPLAAQSALESTPNIKGTWTLRPGTASFVFAHRFISLEGGDEVFNFPTLSLAVGLPANFTLGYDHTTNTETVASKLGGNETELWLKRTFPVGPGAVAGVAAYNTAARSFDGAVTGRMRAGPVTLLAEGRGFSKMFGTEGTGFAAAGGAILHVNRFLGVFGDAGRVLSADTFGTVWTGGVAVAIPGSPHTFSFYASNGSVATLQGASHPRSLFPEKVRYGFTFTVPLGGPRRWMQILHPPAERPATDSSAAPATGVAGEAAAGVVMANMEFRQHEVRIRAGQSVRWTNSDDDVHSVVADDGSWSSPDMPQRATFVHRFGKPGRYPYYCQQHPDMTGVVVVE
jgi:plastocyanin